MKRPTVIFMLVIILASGCNNPPVKTGTDKKISVVCTVFPQYDWVRQILGNGTAGIDISLLSNNSGDLHNYRLSVDDVVKISSCDLFIYTGGESDKWVGGALKEAVNKDMVAINLLDALGSAAKLAESAEEPEEEEEHEEYDEHIWLSLKNARVLCSVIADALCALDSDNAEAYRRGLEAYTEKLVSLDLEFQTAVNESPVKTLLFCDRFPFRYLTDDYGLSYYAAFSGCSAETEASFETVIFLSNKADEMKLKNIMVTESSDQSIAKTVKDNTKDKNQQILVLDSMQSADTGEAYISVMEKNLNTLKQALR